MSYLHRCLQGNYRSYRSAFSFILALLILSFSLFVNLSSSSFKAFSPSTLAYPTLAISQFIEHEALDKVRRGILDELARQGYQAHKNINIIYKNAQGNITLAGQIAQQLAAEKPTLLLGIATPSAQTLAQAAQKKGLPLLFATITDPVQAGLVKNLKHPGNNITGTRNFIPVEKEIQLIQQILPRVKTIGVVLNEAEPNSVQLLKAFTQEAQRAGLEVKIQAVSTSAEVQLALTRLSTQIDALFLLQDNTVASALPLVLKVAKAQRLPVFSAYLDAVKAGALAGLACDEYKLGQQTARMAIKILQGQKPSTLAVEDPVELDLALNQETAKELQLSFNPQLLQKQPMSIPKQGGSYESSSGAKPR